MLPNLQENLPELAEDDTDGVFWLRSKSGRLRCDARYGAVHDGWTPQRMMDLGEALEDWFRCVIAQKIEDAAERQFRSYWGYDHQYQTHMMSIRQGGLLPRPLQETGDIDRDLGTVSRESESDVDDTEEQALNEEDQAPQTWRKHRLVVVDPFIRTKVSQTLPFLF